jgi:hypothetical protein
MLTADPAELRGEGASNLATHVAACDECRAVARAMDADLQAMFAIVPARRARRMRRVALFALPVAATIVGVVVARPSHNEDSPTATVPVNAASQHVVSIEVARGQQATVFKTSDPKVTVVWLTPGGADDNP